MSDICILHSIDGQSAFGLQLHKVFRLHNLRTVERAVCISSAGACVRIIVVVICLCMPHEQRQDVLPEAAKCFLSEGKISLRRQVFSQESRDGNMCIANNAGMQVGMHAETVSPSARKSIQMSIDGQAGQQSGRQAGSTPPMMRPRPSGSRIWPLASASWGTWYGV